MDQDYRPKYIEFDVALDDSVMPLSMGNFETADEAQKFIMGNLTAVNQSLTVARHMDNFEKSELRNQYHDLLENQLPRYEREYSDKAQIANEAKKEEKEASERVNATLTEAKILAKEVKRGTKEMRLDDMYTYRVPYHGKYYYYSYIDQQVRLVAIRDIQEHEKSEIWNGMAANEEFLEKQFGNAEVEAQEG